MREGSKSYNQRLKDRENLFRIMGYYARDGRIAHKSLFDRQMFSRTKFDQLLGQLTGLGVIDRAPTGHGKFISYGYSLTKKGIAEFNSINNKIEQKTKGETMDVNNQIHSKCGYCKKPITEKNDSGCYDKFCSGKCSDKWVDENIPQEGE